MMKMRAKYIIAIALLICLAAAFEFFVILQQDRADMRMGYAIQTAAVFVALIAAVIAMSAADPKPNKVRVQINQTINPIHVALYKKSELPTDFLNRFADHPDPIISHRVEFTITNTSGFTLKRPTLTFRLPLDRQHPHKVGDRYVLSFNSNLFNSQRELRLLEFADTRLLSNSNMPYWNNGDRVTIWIRMIVAYGKSEQFMVEISVNSENAEGVTKRIQISAKDLLSSRPA
jgi:multisubunit Na+/H+ antiporter MnhC subunit